MSEYIAKTTLTNDKTGKRFKPGEKISDADFPKDVITNWLAIGALNRFATGGPLEDDGTVIVGDGPGDEKIIKKGKARNG